MGDLLLPVGPRRMSSWEAHQHRVPRSTEPGTDFYCPIGTPVYAPWDGRVYGWGNSIIPATGRWVGLDLTNGQRFRAMHFSRIVLSESVLRNGGFVRKGQLIAYSGASGYGDNDWSDNPDTGGAHTHVTLWPTHETRFGYRPNGKPYTIDFMSYADTSQPSGGGGVTPNPTPKPPLDEEEEEEMKPFLIWKKNPNNTRQWALISGDLARMVPIFKLETANALGKIYGAATLVVQNEWDGFVRASEISVALTDATEPA